MARAPPKPYFSWVPMLTVCLAVVVTGKIYCHSSVSKLYSLSGLFPAVLISVYESPFYIRENGDSEKITELISSIPGIWKLICPIVSTTASVPGLGFPLTLAIFSMTGIPGTLKHDHCCVHSREPPWVPRSDYSCRYCLLSIPLQWCIWFLIFSPGGGENSPQLITSFNVTLPK